ncbi:MAG: hypothetical protein H6819_09040 [Phycisphaerales bacterium]|nr:hypothetical protein [Phycisphaerales bacterium]MCB9856027.1 hypothetical protein [Phycisphaerales bacterium]
MRATAFIIITGLALSTACSQNTRGPDQHPAAAKTIVEIRGMSYPDTSAGDRPPQTFVNTDEDDIKRFEQWLRAHRSAWQPAGTPPDRRPAAACSIIYGDGKTLDFAIDDNSLVSGDQKLPLSEADYQFVKQICLKR